MPTAAHPTDTRRGALELRLVARLLGVGLALSVAVRLAILAATDTSLSLGTTLGAFLVGVRLDASFVAWLLLPAWLVCSIAAERWRRRGVARGVVLAWLAVATFGVLVGGIADVLHFREFSTRLHGGALDYLQSPTLLIATLGDDFSVLPVLVGAAAAAIGAAWITRRWVERHAADARPRRAASFAVLVALAFLAWAGVADSGTTWGAAWFSPHRAANQLALNGSYNVAFALVQEMRHGSTLEARVADVDLGEAIDDLLPVLTTPSDRLLDVPDNPLWRVTDTGRPRRDLNVVIVLMESFDARGIGCLGGRKTGAPVFDALADDGLLFTRCFAVGSRTNRALGGVLSSLPSLPGPAALRSPGAETGLFSIAHVLRERGYRTLGVHGGDRGFDNLNGYLAGGGFERLIARDDFESPRWSTSWGVSDEEVFERAVEEFSSLGKGDAPFLGFVLTLTNHRPYTCPDGRVEPYPEGTPRGARKTTFRYADWALGHFMDLARKTEWFDDTVFVFVADHGQDARHEELVDVRSYHVPLLVVAPAHVAAGRDERVVSQLDVAPTVLGLLGGQYAHCFFGRDAIRHPPERAVIHADESLLWLNGDGRITEWTPTGSLVGLEFDGRRVHRADPPSGNAVDGRVLRALARVTLSTLRSGHYRPLDATR